MIDIISMAAPSMAAVIMMLLLIALYSYFRQVIVLFSRLSFWARVPVCDGYGRHCFTPANVGFIEFYLPASIWRLVTLYYRFVLPTNLWTRPYVDRCCVLAVHDLNTVRAAIALGDTYKHVIPFTNITLPSHARSPLNRKRYQISSVSVPLMYDAAYHRHAVPRCALSVVSVSSPTKVGLFDARSVASSGNSQSISTWVSELTLTAAGLVETWHDGQTRQI